MKYEWDEAKNEQNIRMRGLDFGCAIGFEWDAALVIEDDRRDYGERRFRAMGRLSEKVHVLVYTLRHGKVRIISLRRANKREERIYEKTGKT